MQHRYLPHSAITTLFYFIAFSLPLPPPPIKTSRTRLPTLVALLAATEHTITLASSTPSPFNSSHHRRRSLSLAGGQPDFRLDDREASTTRLGVQPRQPSRLSPIPGTCPRLLLVFALPAGKGENGIHASCGLPNGLAVHWYYVC